MLPPEQRPKDKHHKVGPSNQHPLTQRDLDVPLPLLPLVADFQEALRVVRNHTVKLVFDAPFHHGLLVDRPDVHRPPLRFHIADEACSEEWQHERLLQHVEGDVGDREELARVRDGEADVRYGIGGEVFRAEREEFEGPAADDQALVPGFEGTWGDRLYGFGNEAHDVVGVIIELKGYLE